MPLVSEWTVTDKRPRYNSSFAGVHFESFEKDLNSLPLHESFLVNQKGTKVHCTYIIPPLYSDHLTIVCVCNKFNFIYF